MDAVKGEKINFRRAPYRGLISEIAREEGVTQGAISQALRMKNPKVMQIVADRARQRREAYEEEVRRYEEAMTVKVAS
jgi:hypothetical protein